MTDNNFVPLVLIDADACPVKDEAIDIALRHGTPIVFIANQGLRLPRHELIKREVVSDGFDAADDAIVEQAHGQAVVVTADILLADRCLKNGAVVMAPNGKIFTDDGIGAAIATRAIMADLRAGAGGETIGGPKPFSKDDRSRFKQALDAALVRLKASHSC